MRIGIYIGRHGGTGGGMALYAASIVRDIASSASGIETVFVYAEPAFLQGFEQVRPEEPEKQDRLQPRPLPPVPRTFGFGRYLGILLDQLLLPLMMRRDGVELVHATSNYGLVMTGLHQLVTVHDLFQAYPLEAGAAPGAGRFSFLPAVKRFLFPRFYRLLFGAQFRRVRHVITDTRAIAEEIHRRYGYPRADITTIPLGLDKDMYDFWKSARFVEQRREETRSWLAGHGIQAGYVLVLASSDPRKNLARTLSAWKELPMTARWAGLVIHFLDAGARTIASDVLGEELAAPNVKTLDWLPRKEVPFLFSSARVVALPTLGEGFGLPALEAACLGVAVVSAPLEPLAQHRGVFHCDPREVGSIARALQAAVESRDESGPPGEPEDPEARVSGVAPKRGGANFLLSVSPHTNGSPRPRTMEDVSQDTLELYGKLERELGLRRAPSRGEARP